MSKKRTRKNCVSKYKNSPTQKEKNHCKKKLVPRKEINKNGVSKKKESQREKSVSKKISLSFRWIRLR